MLDFLKEAITSLREQASVLAQEMNGEAVTDKGSLSMAQARDELEKVRVEYAKVLAEAARNRAIITERQAKIAGFQAAAEAALKDGDETQARTQLALAMTEESSLNGLMTTITELDALIVDLQKKIQLCEERITASEREKAILESRRNAAEANVKAHDAVDRATGKADAPLRQLRDEANSAQALSEAVSELSSNPDDLVEKFSNMESSARLEERMDALKQKLSAKE